MSHAGQSSPGRGESPRALATALFIPGLCRAGAATWRLSPSLGSPAADSLRNENLGPALVESWTETGSWADGRSHLGQWDPDRSRHLGGAPGGEGQGMKIASWENSGLGGLQQSGPSAAVTLAGSLLFSLESRDS